MTNNNTKEIKTRAKEVFDYLNYFLNRSKMPENKFIIFAHYRSGSTLLADLLNCHPDIFCDGEIFIKFIHLDFKKVLFPALYLKSQAIKAKSNVYGCDFKLDQLIHICSRFFDSPEKFILKLYQSEWKIIYLQRRNILRQGLSICTANIRQHWHDVPEQPLERTKINISFEKLLQAINFSKKIAFKEIKLLQEIPHLKLVYEDDLLKSEQHQITLDRVFQYLDLPSTLVQTKLKRVSSDNLIDQIYNLDEIIKKIQQTEYAKFIDF